MPASPNDFVEVVARARGLRVLGPDRHFLILQPPGEPPTWRCELDDGTTTADDKDPPASVRWICPELRVLRAEPPLLAMHRAGPHSDLGRAVAWLGRLAGRAPADPPRGSYVYTDPHGILDAPLRHRVENGPPAMNDDGVVRPTEIWSIRISGEGLVVSSSSWWSSAPALEHQLALAIDVAGRLAAQQGLDLVLGAGPAG